MTDDTQPEALADDRHDACLDHAEFRKQVFQRFHHVAQIGFRRIVQQCLELQSWRHQRQDHQAVLGNGVEGAGLAVEATLIGEAMGDVLDRHVVDMRAGQEEAVTEKGRNVGRIHCELFRKHWPVPAIP